MSTLPPFAAGFDAAAALIAATTSDALLACFQQLSASLEADPARFPPRATLIALGKAVKEAHPGVWAPAVAREFGLLLRASAAAAATYEKEEEKGGERRGGGGGGGDGGTSVSWYDAAAPSAPMFGAKLEKEGFGGLSPCIGVEIDGLTVTAPAQSNNYVCFLAPPVVGGGDSVRRFRFTFKTQGGFTHMVIVHCPGFDKVLGVEVPEAPGGAESVMDLAVGDGCMVEERGGTRAPFPGTWPADAALNVGVYLYQGGSTCTVEGM